MYLHFSVFSHFKSLYLYAIGVQISVLGTQIHLTGCKGMLNMLRSKHNLFPYKSLPDIGDLLPIWWITVYHQKMSIFFLALFGPVCQVVS